MYVSREDRVTCACHEGIGWGVIHHAVFAYNIYGVKRAGESPGVHLGGPG